MDDYKTRKEKELLFLQKYSDGEKYLNKKELITKIKSLQMLKSNIPLSNDSIDKFCFGKNYVDYTYFRFKNNYTIYNEQKLVGLQYDDEWQYKTIFFNSGMAAISALLESIFEMQTIGLTYSEQIYFETYMLLCKENRTKEKFFAYSDAMEPDFNIDNIKTAVLKTNCLGAILDTTCITETKLEEFVNFSLKNGKLVFLVKSLTKLDMFASEYSRMGVLTLIAPQKANDDLSSLYNDLCVKVVERNIRYGSCPMPVDFPPFWDDELFFELNNTRILKIKTNNQLVYEKLKANESQNVYSIIKPNHNLFLVLYPKKSYRPKTLFDACQEIVAKLNEKFDLRFCGSFGFDFIAIDIYINVSDNKPVVRLSLNDYDADMVESFAQEFLKVVNECL